MFRSSLTRWVVVLLLAFVGCSVGAQDEQFKSLFDGKTLEGWEGDADYWSVQDGAITGTLTAEKPLKQNTFLIWRDGTVRDFELHVMFKIVGGNSGIQYRSSDLGDFVVAGYQADIVAGEPDKYTGILYEERGRGIIAMRGQKVVIDEAGRKRIETFAEHEELAKAIEPEQWNHYVVVARGNHLVQTINGVKMVEVTDTEQGKSAREGILAFQLHTGPAMVVQFKDVMLREMEEE